MGRVSQDSLESYSPYSKEQRKGINVAIPVVNISEDNMKGLHAPLES